MQEASSSNSINYFSVVLIYSNQREIKKPFPPQYEDLNLNRNLQFVLTKPSQLHYPNQMKFIKHSHLLPVK